MSKLFIYILFFSLAIKAQEKNMFEKRFNISFNENFTKNTLEKNSNYGFSIGCNFKKITPKHLILSQALIINYVEIDKLNSIIYDTQIKQDVFLYFKCDYYSIEMPLSVGYRLKKFDFTAGASAIINFKNNVGIGVDGNYGVNDVNIKWKYNGFYLQDNSPILKRYNLSLNATVDYNASKKIGVFASINYLPFGLINTEHYYIEQIKYSNVRLGFNYKF